MSFPVGWYDDPENQTQQRYWDGSVWTDQRRPREQQPSPYQGQYGQPAQGQPQYGQPAQHGQVYGGAQSQQPNQDRPVYGQPGPQQPQQQAPQPQYGQPAQHGQQPQQHGYPAYPQQQGGYPAYPQQGGYGYPGQNRFATPDGQPLSGWWRRVGARIIDNILAGIVALPFTGYFFWQYIQWMFDYLDFVMDSAAAGAQPPTSALPPEVYKWIIPITLISAAVAFAYEFFFLTKKGATPGKMALGIAVRERDRPGLPSSAAVAKRAGFFAVIGVLGLVPLVGTLLGLVALLDDLWPLWDDKKQALHEKWPNTNVVRT
ncbi:RDD family protein [Kribbella sp. NBC_01505]|uniref:RDD family protein n=1 Tax=Kribbella sp. NBC_01505 TaxID=2903580 RepID=UPI00386F6E10